MDPIVLNVFDEGRVSYTIGDTLNMPYFFAKWNNTPHYDDFCYQSFKRAAIQYQNNILGIYASLRTDDDEPIPNVEKIVQACDLYLEQNINQDADLKSKSEMWDDEDTLYIHLRSGDKGVVEDCFIETIVEMSSKYNRLIVMCGIHHNGHNTPYFASVADSKSMLLQSLSKIQSRCQVIIDTSEPDTHLCMMRNCKNLLVHRGGFSVLGALLFNSDNLYITKTFYFPTENRKDEFFGYIKKYNLI
jgi:hypothetical protein